MRPSIFTSKTARLLPYRPRSEALREGEEQNGRSDDRRSLMINHLDLIAQLFGIDLVIPILDERRSIKFDEASGLVEQSRINLSRYDPTIKVDNSDLAAWIDPVGWIDCDFNARPMSSVAFW